MQAAGNVFVVTGAGNGIGRCVALELIGRGATVAGADLDDQALPRTAALASDPGRFTAYRLDIADRDAVAAFPETVIAAHGQLDGVFSIVGLPQPLPAPDW